MVARRIGAVLLALALGGGLAACGDDGGSDSDAVDQVDRDGTSSDGDDGDGSTDDGDGDSDIPDGVFDSQECAEMAVAFSGLSGAFAAGSEGEVEEMEAFFEDAVDNVPDDLRDDFEVYARTIGDYIQILRDAGFEDGDFNPNDPAALAVITQAMAALSTPEMQAAGESISAFFANNCEG
jgi:hypothetical protein